MIILKNFDLTSLDTLSLSPLISLELVIVEFVTDSLLILTDLLVLLETLMSVDKIVLSTLIDLMILF